MKWSAKGEINKKKYRIKRIHNPQRPMRAAKKGQSSAGEPFSSSVETKLMKVVGQGTRLPSCMLHSKIFSLCASQVVFKVDFSPYGRGLGSHLRRKNDRRGEESVSRKMSKCREPKSKYNLKNEFKIHFLK